MSKKSNNESNVQTKKVSSSSESLTKSIEQKYQSMTQEEHILARPDTYIGDVQQQVEEMFIFDKTSNNIIKRNITYVPGLYKIFDEIVVNARDQSEIDKTCDTIMVNINQETNTISVYNNGKGIDVEIHKDHNIYVPELIFGKLLTSTNYDDTESRTTGGRNGYGAKLTNIFSKKFIVEIVDFNTKRKFYQEFSDNMTKRTVPLVEELKICKNGYTKITFTPDLTKFKGLTKLSDDMVSLLIKRVYDLAGLTNKCKVYLNDKRIECKDFKSYISLYRFEGMPEEEEPSDNNELTSNNGSLDEDKEEIYKLFYEQVNTSWEIGFMYAPDNGNEQISFVNGVCTYHGGTHVNYVTDMVINKLKELVGKKYKDITLKPNQIKDNLIVFVKSTIINPAFTSQTKETLKTKVSDFGSICNIKDAMLTKFSKSGILNQVVNLIKLKEQAILKKTDGKKVTNIKGIPKLEDANKAGGKDSHKCKLILTEGDSAKALAMSGRAVTGSDYYGIFPLRGKLLNVREASPKQLLENEEIINIKKIMGFQHEKDYTDVSTLRYGGIILMTDQDHDGYHIKGLLLNFIHYFWPSLLRIPNFITTLTTPIVKATRGKEQMIFYNLSDYEEWKKTVQNKWNIKYYKGLGTSDAKEAREYFTDIENKLINYLDDQTILNMNQSLPLEQSNNESESDLESDEDEEEHSESESESEIEKKPKKLHIIKPKYKDLCSEFITLAFERKRADDRKLWLKNYNYDLILNNSQKQVSIGEFVNKELIHFSNEDIHRSIPSLCDGFKPSQRKVLFATILKGLKTKSDEIRVAQLASYVSERTCYHHGEASLTGTIINMAQNFVGSNNINLLYPSGQYGTRVIGGSDSASPRYIHTFLGELTRLIFRVEDDPILKYLDDDGVSIEPEYFIPIIPMILVNGSEGIGTGFSTKVPCHNPLILIDNVLAMIDDKKIQPMIPWYKNFTGQIKTVPEKPNDFLIYGTCTRIDETRLRITELPIGTWTTDYKAFLDGLEEKGIILSYQTNNTEELINIVVDFDSDKLDTYLQNGSIYSKLNLVSKKSTTNMHLYNDEGCITKYPSPVQILEDFYNIRLDAYVRRKEYIINKLEKELNILQYKMKFIKDILDKNIIIERRKKQDIINQLITLKYPMLAVETDSESYDYLINIPLLSLSDEKIQELQNKLDRAIQELAKIRAISEEDLWKIELNELRTEYIKWLKSYAIEKEIKLKPTVAKTVAKPLAKPVTKPLTKSKVKDL